MERNVIRGYARNEAEPDLASLYPGYLLFAAVHESAAGPFSNMSESAERVRLWDVLGTRFANSMRRKAGAVPVLSSAGRGPAGLFGFGMLLVRLGMSYALLSACLDRASENLSAGWRSGSPL
jgi:hypothetical protein